jgi:hypothetical protein
VLYNVKLRVKKLILSKVEANSLAAFRVRVASYNDSYDMSGSGVLRVRSRDFVGRF